MDLIAPLAVKMSRWEDEDMTFEEGYWNETAEALVRKVRKQSRIWPAMRAYAGRKEGSSSSSSAVE